MRHFFLLLLLSLSLQLAFADEQLRGTQEELRRRNLYFGDIDGRSTGETTEALRRYQARKGFTATGKPDHDTLRSLGLLSKEPGEAPPKPLEWPAEPVLKSDSKLNAPAEAAQIAQETGVSSATIAGSDDLSFAQRGRGAHVATQMAIEAAAKHWAVAPASRARHIPAGTTQRLGDTDLAPLVADYFHAVSGHRLRDELHFYADRVAYFSSGGVDRRIIERSLQKYYQRWPSHEFHLAGPVRYARLPRRGEIAIVCPVKFVLKRHGTVVKGATLTQLVVNSATRDPRIVSIQERRIQGG